MRVHVNSIFGETVLPYFTLFTLLTDGVTHDSRASGARNGVPDDHLRGTSIKVRNGRDMLVCLLTMFGFTRHVKMHSCLAFAPSCRVHCIFPCKPMYIERERQRVREKEERALDDREVERRGVG